MTTRQRNNIPSAPGVSIATAYSVVAFVSTFLFGFIYYFLAVNMFMSTVLLVVAVLLVINYMMLRQTGNFERTVNVILGLGLIVMILLFATGGWQNTGYLWPIAFLPFVILLGKRKNAIFWALSLFIGCIAAVGLDAVHIISIPYNRVELFNYFGALTTFVAFIYVYHRATVDYEDFLSYTGSLLEANTDPFFTINNDGTIADVNKAAEKYTGLNRAELIGSVFAGYFTDARQVAEICQKVFSGDRAHNYPLSLKSKDGNVAPIILSATLYRDESTKTLRVFATARDVTEQTQAELALRESEERFRLLVEGVRDYAILMLDVDGNIKSWNNGAERIKGYQANEIIGKNMSVFYTEEAIKNFEPERNLEMVRKKGSFENVGWRVKKDGTLFWADVVFTALYNDTGELRGFTKVTRDITEKRNAEEAIIRQAALVQVLPDAIVYGEKEGLKITHMNEAAEHMFGVTLAEAIGEKLDDFVGIVPVGATREEVGKAVWTGDGYWRGEAVFTLKNGKRLNILGTSKTIKDYKGEPTRWMGVFSDITSIKETEERLQIALDGMAAGLWEWKISEDKRWWSPKYFELLGYANNEIEPSSATLKVLLHPDDAALAFGTINAHLTQTQGFKIEVRYKTKEGIYKWYQVSGKTHFDEGSRALRMVGVLIDIDEKKRAEIIIRQQAALIQMLPDGIIYGDMNSRIVSMNAGAESLFEMKAEDAVGKTIDDLISFKLKGITREASGIELRSKGFVRMEAEMISPSGKKIEVLSSVKLVVNADSLPGWVAIYTDITPLKLNEELKEALRKLEVNNEYMEQLAYISAHDIKSPIIALEGLTNMLHNSNAIKPEYAEVLKMMKNTINQMQRTNHSLNNILKLRKNLLRKEDVSDQSMALGTIVADAQATVQSNLDEINAKVIVELAGVAEVPLPYVHIKSIFLNLLTNAIKYCDPERPLRISITAEKQDDIISFTVQDNGLGIDMDLNKDRIFGIFKRFHDHVEGSGVGLHIVKSIVDAYGGTITVDSTEGVGTSFKISFNTAIIV